MYERSRLGPVHPLWTTSNQKSLKQLSAFLNFHQFAKNYFIPSIHCWDSLNLRVWWINWLHPFLTMPTPKKTGWFLIYVNLYQHAKNFIHSFWKYGWLRNLAIWLAENILTHTSRAKFFPNMGFVLAQNK